MTCIHSMCCFASDREGKSRSLNIDKMIRKEEKEKKKYMKLLLLGAGNSGKSTIVKQMKIIHDNGFTAEDYDYYKPLIFSNTITCLMQIIRGMDKLKIEFEDDDRLSDARLVLEIVARKQDKQPFHPELTAALKRLWNDGGVRECFERSREYQLNDSAEYYLDSLDRIGQRDYNPSQEDLLRVRCRTTAILNIDFRFRGLDFMLTDVGGQRTQRQKWIRCFEDVTAIVFVAALNEYDMTLEEDEATNRLRESLLLFDSILNNEYLGKKPIILFLNKTDLLEKKIDRSPIKDYFEEYKGNNTFDDVCQFIQKQFTDKVVDGRYHDSIYPHRTCATDTKNIEHVFKSVVDIMKDIYLKEQGFTP